MRQTAVFPAAPAFDRAAARLIDRELAEYIEDVAEQPLKFRGAHAIEHSAANHRHLWMIEARADRDRRIDLAFRVRAVSHILHRWRDRLPSYAPSRSAGFRLYLYEDIAPTVSVVAETGEGCPYGGELTFVDGIEVVLTPYAGRSWMANFRSSWPEPETVLSVVGKNAGSLRRSSQTLGIGLAELRRMIECYDLAGEVNAVRKSMQRRPARFGDPDMMLPKLRIWEWRIAPCA